MQCWAKPPPEGQGEKTAALLVSERKRLHPRPAEPRGCPKAARVGPQPLPQLRAGRCSLGDLAAHSHPKRQRELELPDCHLALPYPKLTPPQRGLATRPSSGPRPSETFRLIDGRSPDPVCQDQRPQEAWVLGWHLSPRSGGTARLSGVPHLPGVRR